MPRIYAARTASYHRHRLPYAFDVKLRVYHDGGTTAPRRTTTRPEQKITRESLRDGELSRGEGYLKAAVLADRRRRDVLLVLEHDRVVRLVLQVLDVGLEVAHRPLAVLDGREGDVHGAVREDEAEGELAVLRLQRLS